MNVCRIYSFSTPINVTWLTLIAEHTIDLLDPALLVNCAAMMLNHLVLQNCFHYPSFQIKHDLLTYCLTVSLQPTEQSRDLWWRPPQDHYRTLPKFELGCTRVTEINSPRQNFFLRTGPFMLENPGRCPKKVRTKGHTISTVKYFSLDPNTTLLRIIIIHDP